MLWFKRMFLGGFVVNIIYTLLLFMELGLSMWSHVIISGLLTGAILSLLIKKGYI